MRKHNESPSAEIEILIRELLADVKNVPESVIIDMINICNTKDNIRLNQHNKYYVETQLIMYYSDYLRSCGYEIKRRSENKYTVFFKDGSSCDFSFLQESVLEYIDAPRCISCLSNEFKEIIMKM